MRMGNPAVRRVAKMASRGELSGSGEQATYKGVYLKAALFALVTIISAVAVEAIFWWAVANGAFEVIVPIITATAIVSVVLVVMALVIAFVPSTVKFLGIIYVVLEGALLGLFAALIDALVFPGLSIAAFIATALVFVIALAVNKFTQARVSSRFVRGLMVVVISLVLVEAIMGLLSLFGLFSFQQIWWLQLLISVVCVIWATVMIFWDLQNIDYIVQTGAHKSYEWYFAFSLVTTLIYLYIEILELLVRLFALFANNRN